MIYFVQAASGPIKIGCARDPNAYTNTLRTAHYENLALLGAIGGERAELRELHRKIEPSRIRGEWFRPSPEVLALARRARPAPGDARPRASKSKSITAEMITNAIAAAGNLTGAAELLKMARRTLQARMRVLGMPPHAAGRPISPEKKMIESQA